SDDSRCSLQAPVPSRKTPAPIAVDSQTTLSRIRTPRRIWRKPEACASRWLQNHLGGQSAKAFQLVQGPLFAAGVAQGGRQEVQPLARELSRTRKVKHPDFGFGGVRS